LLQVGAKAIKAGYSILEFDSESGRVEHLGTRRTMADAMLFLAEDFQAFAQSCGEACGEPPTNLLRQTQFIVGPGRLERIVRFRKQPGVKLPVMSICDSDGNELQALKA